MLSSYANIPSKTEDDTYTGLWTKTSPYNHTDHLTAAELMKLYSTTPEAATWYWEKSGEDPLAQKYNTGEGTHTEDGNTVANVYDPSTDNLTEAENKFFGEGENRKETGYWTKLTDDTWTYTFYVYKADVDWRVWESGIPTGYTTDHADGDKITMKYPDEASKAVITNTSTTLPEYGSLSLTKKLAEGSGSATDVSFGFTVTLTGNNDDQKKAISGAKIFGDTAFKDGKASVSLKVNESKTFTDIPAGVTYLIEETDSGGAEKTAFENNTGTIEADNTTEVVCTNTMPATPAVSTNSFTLKNICEEDTSASFHFQVVLTGLVPDQLYSYGTESTFTADQDGMANIGVDLVHNGSVAFNGLPIDATYQVTESASTFIASYEVSDSKNEGKIASYSNANTATNLALSTAKETVDEDETVTVTFTNTKNRFPVNIRKRDAEGFLVTGAELQITGSGQPIESWVTDEGDHMTYLPAGNYTLTETKVPAGYQQADPIEFAVTDSGEVIVGSETVTEVTMIDPKETVTVYIQKQNSLGAPLAGAELQLLDEADNVVHSWTSTDGTDSTNNGVTEISGKLLVGKTYTLHEAKAPFGYNLAADITIEVGTDKKIRVNGEEIGGAIGNPIIMIDRKVTSLPNTGGYLLWMIVLATGLGIFMIRRRQTINPKK